ncbi:MAG: helix-turn-helix transcriptional regulator [Acidobacteria bacterium]|nr:helix-turn-helix transcriptional regulator [Acidobacteriota bacterium]
MVINRVREFRQKRNMTQEELAGAVGVSRQSIISIEKGQYVPSLPLALKLAAYFECATDKLFQLKEGRV